MKTCIAIEIILRGISKFVRTEVAIPPTAPKIEINAISILLQQACTCSGEAGSCMCGPDCNCRQ